jgi:hypothetical protein
MASRLFRFDSGAFGIRVQETVSCALVDMERLFRKDYTVRFVFSGITVNKLVFTFLISFSFQSKDVLQVLKAGNQLIGLIYFNYYGFPFGR